MDRNTLVELVRQAGMAPSSHNTQPWRFVLEPDAIGIQAGRARRLPVVDPDDHALFISLGCALANLRVAAHHYGLAARVSDFPADRDDGTLRPAGAGETTDSPVADPRPLPAIPVRQSARRTCDRRPLAEGLIEGIPALAEEPLVTPRLIQDRERVEMVAGQVEAACQGARSRPAKSSAGSPRAWIPGSSVNQRWCLPGLSICRRQEGETPTTTP